MAKKSKNTKQTSSIEEELEMMEQSFFESIAEDIEEIFKRAIIRSVYAVYQPKVYNRQFQLINHIKVTIRKGELVVYFATAEMHYESVFGMNVTSAVPYWIQYGHHDRSSIQNEYHHYRGRRYMELAQKLIADYLGEDPKNITLVITKPDRV